MTRIRLRPEVAERIAACLLHEGAHELCHLLLGSRQGDTIEAVEQVSLTTTTRARFWVTRPDWERAHRHAERRRLEVVALLHSHPSRSLQLSKADLESLLVTGLPWIIVAAEGDTPRYRAWSSAGIGMPVEIIERAK